MTKAVRKEEHRKLLKKRIELETLQASQDAADARAKLRTFWESITILGIVILAVITAVHFTV